MRRIFIKDIWTLRLAGLCAALGFLLLINSLWQPGAHLPELETGSKADTESAPEESAGADAPEADVAAAMEPQKLPRRNIKPLSAYGATLKRPLFQATRRPAPVPQKAAQGKKPPKPKAPPRSNLNGIRLTGVIRTVEKAFGLLSVPGQSELMRAPVGKLVKGWKVIGVEEAAIVLNNGEEDFRMALWKEKTGPGHQARAPQSPDRKPGTVAGGPN